MMHGYTNIKFIDLCTTALILCWLNLVLNLRVIHSSITYIPSSASSNARCFYAVTVHISLKGRERPDGRVSLQEVKITIEDLDTLLKGIKTMTQWKLKCRRIRFLEKTHLLCRKID